MKKKIIFQKCTIYNLYFLFFIITNCVNYWIEFYIYKENIEKQRRRKKKILFTFTNIILYKQCLSNFLAIILYLIRKRLVRKKEQSIQPLETMMMKMTKTRLLIYL